MENKGDNIAMDEVMQRAFDGISTHIESIKTSIEKDHKQLLELTHNNYTNLKEDIDRVDRNVTELKASWQSDHDRIIKVEEKISQQEKHLELFEARETNYGKQQDMRITGIEHSLTTVKADADKDTKKLREDVDKSVMQIATKLDTLNISIGKIIGVAAGSSLVVALLITGVLKVIEKLMS